MRAFLILTLLVTGAIGVGVAAESATSNPGGWQITARPPLVRVRPEGPCPRSVLGVNDVRNVKDGLSRQLLPPDALFGLICRYGTKSGRRPFALVRTSLVNGRTATAFESAIAGIKTTKPEVTAHCPAALARVTVLASGFAGGEYVDLWYEDSGCQTLDNGYLKASEIENPFFFERFIPLVDAIAPRTR